MPSSVIADYDYDPESETLSIRFRPSGRRYRYFDVPLETVVAFQNAFSKGRYFNAHIRDAFDSAPIEEPGPISATIAEL